MRVALAAALFLFSCVPLLAQAAPTAGPIATPAPAATPAQTATPAPGAAPAATEPALIDDSEVGFKYRLPADWEFVAPPPAPKVTVPFPDAVGAKKGDACVEVVLTAKHGTPASVVVVTELPFACYGQPLKPGDLANFGSGAAEGLKQTFDITNPVEGNYTLGSHALWIERSKGTPKGRPENPFTFEIACTVLEKGAVCWMTMAADWHSLHAFERAPVTLDGDTFSGLVPPHSFVHDSE
ncbi:MAG TPA: hypothetical protein VJX73_02355 [Terracidiphilus sp.]|nr:hypothetical protein [Terracidiphilus sp.]